MNNLHKLVGALAISVGSSSYAVAATEMAPQTFAQQVLAQRADNGADNDIHALDLTPAEQRKARADEAQAKAARAQKSPQQRRGSAEARRTSPAVEMYPDNDSHALDETAAQASKSRSQAAAASKARRARSGVDRRAIRVEKQNELDVLEKSGPGS
jgi:hypothetical protein